MHRNKEGGGGGGKKAQLLKQIAERKRWATLWSEKCPLHSTCQILHTFVFKKLIEETRDGVGCSMYIYNPYKWVSSTLCQGTRSGYRDRGDRWLSIEGRETKKEKKKTLFFFLSFFFFEHHLTVTVLTPRHAPIESVGPLDGPWPSANR